MISGNSLQLFGRLPIVVSMKTIITVLLLLATSAWGGEFWIQVLSMRQGSSLDAAFLKRIEASGYTHKIVEEGGMRKVRLGAFASYREALEALMGIRCRVALDAFIVGAEPSGKVPAVETEAVAAVTPKAGASEAEKGGAALSEKAEEQAAAVETGEREEAAPEKPCICICDKQALRRAEIGAAISYYKTSPYHRFEADPSAWSH